MPKMARAGEDHGDAMGIGRRDYFIITHRATRLNDRRRSRLDGNEQPVSEWEKSV
jgi:hypothetical protein